MSLMDLHHFPLWEKEVHDVLQECFQDMQSIFAFYCKSIGGSDSAEAAVEMNMSEFKDFVRDTGLETKDLRFDVMCGLFIKANATNSDADAQQRANPNPNPNLTPTLILTLALALAPSPGQVAQQRAESKKSAESKNEGKSALAGTGVGAEVGLG